ncbi:putative YbbR family protein [uncultured delta proteobacterium]|uniref:Putative YbbR family protein n=1 Tax=uncultured delta proteobacterium TaxID=34034 RepID=A0A212ITY1_9DELT|nr:putative YbbR family protein [uncultured delta proteobacterium]
MSNASSNTEKPLAKAGKYLRLAAQTVKGIRWTTASIAFCLAVTLWYAVTVRDKVETWVDVGVQFKGAPANLVISEGLINKLSVRVRAARGLSRSLTGREASMVVDLSTITKGSNAIVITRDMLPFTAAYEVVEISPPRIQVVADTMASREIELESRFDGRLATDLFVKTLRLEPQKVTVSGAESLVAGISRIRIPVPLTADMAKGKNTLSVAVPMNANISVAPPQVGIELEVDVRTKQLKLVRDVTVTGNTNGHAVAIHPGKVTIVAEIPESLAKDQAALAAITATVLLSQDPADNNRPLSVAVSLPENAELVSVTPPEVAVAAPTGK